MPATSQTQFLTEILDLNAESIPLGRLAFFREQLRHRLHEVVLRKFIALQDAKPDFTRRDLARRIGRKPEQVTRWLGAAGNLTLDTVSDLLLGMGAVLDGVVLNVDALTTEPKLPRMPSPSGQPERPRPTLLSPAPAQGRSDLRV